MIAAAKPPLKFWVVAGLLLVWGLIGVAGFHIDLATSSETLAKMDPYDRALYESRPGWLIATYGIAVWSGLIGTVLLLFRQAVARDLYIVSLVGVVVLFGYVLGTTDIIGRKGFVTAAGFPLVIAALAAFEIWFAAHARRRGWFGRQHVMPV